jgi:hypothetical protein
MAKLIDMRVLEGCFLARAYAHSRGRLFAFQSLNDGTVVRLHWEGLKFGARPGDMPAPPPEAAKPKRPRRRKKAAAAEPKRRTG